MAGDILGLIFPGLGGLAASGVGWLIAAVKGRKWKAIARASIKGVNKAREEYAKDGMISVKDLMKALAAMHTEENIRKKARAEIHHIEGKKAA